MLKLLTRVIGIAVKLLAREASKERKRANHLTAKWDNHKAAEQKAIANMQHQGAIYRHSLMVDTEISERNADAASALASKLKGVLE